MPYIDQAKRKHLEERKPVYPGELNYLISKMCNDYFAMTGVSYTTINEVIGVLECAKLEVYRRIASPYEDKKIGENGEVYTIL